MFRYLDLKIELGSLFRLLPAVFLIHDLEEILTVKEFWRENREEIPLPPSIKERLEVTTGEMALAVACVSAASVAASGMAARSPRSGVGPDLFAAVAAVRFFNAFVHLAQTLLLRRYTPGVVTALAVSFPSSLYALLRLRSENLLAERSLPRWFVVGALLHGPVVVGAQAFGRALARLLHVGSS